MISELTVMANREFIMKPSIFPPRPITISRRLWAQKSITHFIWMFRGSMSRRRRFFAASIALSSLNSCCILDVSATIARLWALATQSISPVSPREKGVRGMHWESPRCP